MHVSLLVCTVRVDVSRTVVYDAHALCVQCTVVVGIALLLPAVLSQFVLPSSRCCCK